MDKKVGIITFHRYQNYGCVLQAYSLLSYINSLPGYKAEIIDYYQESELKIWNYSPYTLFKYKKYCIYNFLYGKKVYNRFNKFQKFVNKNFKLSKKYIEPAKLNELSNKYDIYVSGSDQIWNYYFSINYSCKDLSKARRLMLPYYLNFTNSNNKIAYASSMGDAVNYPMYNKQFIGKYKKIFVREEKQKYMLAKYLNRADIEQVIDPTLLINFKQYLKIMDKSHLKFKYIFAYIFDYDKEEYKFILKMLKNLSIKLNMKVIMVNNTLPVNNYFINTKIDVSPSEWLSLIKNAELVITNSFHGTIFSINFNVPFYTISADVRKTSILNLLNLSDRNISYNENANNLLNYSIDYISVNKILEKERERSKKLLKEALDMCK